MDFPNVHAQIKTLLLLSFLSCSFGSQVSFSEPIQYRDIYLTQNRVCRDCSWELLNKPYVQLTNRQGSRSAVRFQEIIGVDEHPLMRKLFQKSLHDTGLAAKVIVPYAFEDAQDFVCKYCD